MPRATASSPKPATPATKKESGDASKKSAPDRKKPIHKRRGGGARGGDDDDESVDSRGNLRGFIARSDEEEEMGSSEEESFHTDDETSSGQLTPEQRQEVRRSARKAAVKAREAIRKKLAKSASSDTLPSAASGHSAASGEDEPTPKPKLRIRSTAGGGKRSAGVVDSSDESESEGEEVEVVKSKRKSGGFQPRALQRRLRKARAPSPIEEDSEEEDETSEEEERPQRRGRGRERERYSRRRREEESEEEEEEDETSEEDEEEEYDSDDDEDYEDDEAGGPAGLIISIGGGGDDVDDRMIPKRHNMKKESAEVKKFVKLVTEPHEEGGIDDQIDEFKALTKEKQAELLTVLERKPGSDSTKQSMMFRILTMKLPPDTQAMVLAKYNALQAMDPGAGEYFKHRAWLEKLTSLPLGVYRDIPARIEDGAAVCGAFMERARKCLGDAIYGQEEAKIQVLQFIASKIANPAARGLSLLLAGPPGIGKTSLIKNGIAKALNWPFQFVSLGGDSDASTYVGHQLVYEGSHCGKIANSLADAKSMSMILMFDELDKISTTPKGEEVQNLLVHLTDPVQNGDFEDKYLSGIPLDLSKVLFTFSANDLGKIDRVLMDRMVVIQLKGYSEKEKLAIAGNFLLPAALREVKLDEKVAIGPEVLEHILKEYARGEEGVRELKRCIEAVVQKINMLRIFNAKDLPFHISDFQLPFVVKKAHVDLFLKKKEGNVDPSIAHLYT
jgi:hypothetical protein